MELVTVLKRSPLNGYWEKVKVGLKWMFNIHMWMVDMEKRFQILFFQYRSKGYDRN